MARSKPGSAPLKNPKHELFAIERAAGLDDEGAYAVSGLWFHLPRQEGEQGGKRRSRIVQQALRRLDARIRALDELTGTKGIPQAEWVRNLRAAAELRWARGVTANGGTEPDDWAEPLDEPAEEDECLAYDGAARLAPAPSE